MWIVQRQVSDTAPWVQWGEEHPTCDAARKAYLAADTDDEHDTDTWHAVEVGVDTVTECPPVNEETSEPG